jgi:hypothetical protein
MKSLQYQLSEMFGKAEETLGDSSVRLVPEAHRILGECGIQADCVVVSPYQGGLELRINLAEGWGIVHNGIVASGSRPVVNSKLTERLLGLSGVRRVVYWDTTGRYIAEDHKTQREDCSTSAASIPLMISTVVRKYANEANRQQFSEAFKQLEDSLDAAGSPEWEDLCRGMGRLTQEQINKFYGLFKAMPD